MMKYTIQDCICDNWIIEDGFPVAKVDIRSYNRTFLFIAHINQLKEKIRVLFVDWQIAKFINDQKLILAEML